MSRPSPFADVADNLRRMFYDHPDGTKYLLNLLDTPGHADFSSELLRSLLPSQGALLLVDAAQVSRRLLDFGSAT